MVLSSGDDGISMKQGSGARGAELPGPGQGPGQGPTSRLGETGNLGIAPNKLSWLNPNPRKLVVDRFDRLPDAEGVSVSRKPGREDWFKRRKRMEAGKEKHTPKAIKERRHWVAFRQMLAVFGLMLRLCGLYERGIRNARNIRQHHDRRRGLGLAGPLQHPRRSRPDHSEPKLERLDQISLIMTHRDRAGDLYGSLLRIIGIKPSQKNRDFRII